MSLQKIRVTKAFTFDMAHALYGHNGLCKNIHGHTYKLQITLLGQALHEYGNPKDGMLIDFSDLKKIVRDEVISIYDHALILNGNSPHSGIKEIRENFEKVVYFENQPTCENMLLSIVLTLKKALPVGTILCAVRLHETPTSSAE